MKIHENTRNSWNFMKFREKGAVLAPDWKTYWIPIGIQWISDAPVGYTYLECTDFHGISGKSIKIWEFRRIPPRIMVFLEMLTLRWRAPQNHWNSLGNIDVFASGPGELDFHRKSWDFCECCYFSRKSRKSWNFCFCGEIPASPAPTQETLIFLREYWWFWGAFRCRSQHFHKNGELHKIP